MNRNLLNTIVLFFAFFGSTILYSQNFAEKKYYLVDSLNLESLTLNDKQLIDSSLHVFHNTKIDTIKAKTINSLVAYLSNEKDWSQYNNWLTEFTRNKLKDSQLTIKERRLLINVQALTLNNEGYRLRGKSRYKEALVVYFKSLKILEEIDDKSGQGNVLNNIGAIYKSLGEIPNALEYYQKSLALKREVGNRKGEAYSLNNIAIIYKNLGDINKALETYLISLSVLESLNDKKGTAAVLNNIASVYDAQGNNQKAEEYFNKSLSLNTEINNKSSIANTLGHLASIYEAEGNKEKCLQYIEKSIKIYKEIGNKSGEAASLRRLGLFYIENDDSEAAIDLINKSLEISRVINEKEGQIHSLNILSKYFIAESNIKEAKKYILKSMSLSKELGFPREIKAAAEILTTIYEKENNWPLAYKIQKLYLQMQDSIRSKTVHESILKQQAKYYISKKEQEIKVLSAQNDLLKKDQQIQNLNLYKNRLTIILISIALLLTLLFSAANLRWNKKKKKIYKLLKQQKEEISVKSDEKTAMLREIHHRVKNNLQTVNSLLRLQAKEIKDPEIVAKFKETQKRVITIASLHEKMYGTDNLKYIDAKEHLTTLTEDLVNTYSVDKNIQLNVNIAPVTFGVKTLVPLGLIINEVVINSLKYAFQGRENGKLGIQLKVLENKKFEMLITDNGIGLEKDAKKGLGTRLIKIFTKQLQGTVEQMNHTGLGYKIVFHSIDDLNF